jgi:putative ABC transport system ATP-binding protein
MTLVLKADNLRKQYMVDGETITAVDNISFELKAGEFMAIVGPSGSGKTTLLAMIAGLLIPTNGRIVLGGDDLSQLNDKELVALRRQRIGFTFQANNLVPFLNAQQNVELMLRLNGHPSKDGRARAKELLNSLGLEDHLNNLPSQLSAGQKQRVAIARSLIHDPNLVLADEPTASLDTKLAYQVVETFAELIHKQNRAGIMVTHDLRMCRFVDRVIQIVDGLIRLSTSDCTELEALANFEFPDVLAEPGNEVQKNRT